MDIQLTQDRLAEERAFVQRYTDTIASRPVNYAADYTAPAEARPRKVGIIGIPLADPPLHNEPVAGPSNEWLDLTIKSLKPPFTREIGIRASDSVLELKKLVADACQSATDNIGPVTVDAQRLLLKGKALADSKLLKEYDLSSGSTVHLVIKPTSLPPVPPPTMSSGVATVPAPAAAGSTTHAGAVPDLSAAAGSASSPSNPGSPSGSSSALPRPHLGHARVPSLTITTETDSPSGTSSPGKEIPLSLTDAPPLGPQAQVSSAAFHQTIADPAFWEKMHALCLAEFATEVDADQAWEAFLLSVKGRLSAGEAAKIRDVVGVRGQSFRFR